MAGLLLYPRGVGLFDEIGRDNLAAPPAIPVVIGAFNDGDEPRVVVALPLPDQSCWLLAELSLALFLTAADACANAQGDPRSDRTCLRCGGPLPWR
jgi:hypothetical protein